MTAIVDAKVFKIFM